MHKLLNNLEDLYDTYSPMLYSMALEIAPTQHDAESLLVNTFLSANKLKLTDHNHTVMCVKLIRLTLETAKGMFQPEYLKDNLKLNQFNNTPITHQLLVQQIGFDNYCTVNKLSRGEAAKYLRQEMLAVREG